MKILLMYKPGPEHFKKLKSIAPSATFAIALNEETAKREISNSEIVLGNRYFIQALPFAKKLKLMQSNSVGMDLILSAKLMQKNKVILANARGIYDADLADHALSMFLAIARGLTAARINQSKAQWKRWPIESLSAGQALVLGYGGVGEQIVQRLAAFNIKTFASCKYPNKKNRNTKLLKKLVGPKQWRGLLPEIKYVFMTLPLTKETLHIMSRQELAALPQDAIIINIGRGLTLDEAALRQSIKQGKFTGVGLDVFTEEPLPKNNWMWAEERILISPHLGRNIEQASFKWEPLFENNLKNFINHKPLLNLVDKKAGY